MRTQRSGTREGLVLAITAISVIALVGAGLSSHSDPDLAGRAALTRLSSEVASGVLAEWEQLRRDPQLIDGELLTWTSEPGPAPEPVERMIPGEGNVVAAALLIEARRLEHETGDADAALEVVLDVFSKDPDSAQRASARLRAIQLSVALEKYEIAAQQWTLASSELSGLECASETSTLLLCALAAAPALTLEARAQARDSLVGLWSAGALALPAAQVEGNPLREVFRERLQALLPEGEPDSRLERSVLMERARLLAENAGHVLAPDADGGAHCIAIDRQELLYRSAGEALIEGRFVPVGTLGAAIRTAVERVELLPEGFALDLTGDDESAGSIVRERVALGFGAGDFVLRHSNPESVISAVSEKQTLLRGALFILALAVAGAGFSVFRALRRERHLDNLKSTFVANVSHELRTPISSILLMAENLENDRLTSAETSHRYHKLIRREAERLRRLVNDVLDFSRIERGKGVHLSLNDINVAEFARELEREARERAESTDGELAFDSNSFPAQVVADEDALRRATLNLIDNAMRHSGTTSVELELGGNSAGDLLIRVRDRGRGVPKDRVDSLFEPFERIELPVEDAGGSAGTGLGLAIVREIAEGHGGSASALASDEPGLTIELRIPANPPTTELS